MASCLECEGTGNQEKYLKRFKMFKIVIINIKKDESKAFLFGILTKVVCFFFGRNKTMDHVCFSRER